MFLIFTNRSWETIVHKYTRLDYTYHQESSFSLANEKIESIYDKEDHDDNKGETLTLKTPVLFAEITSKMYFSLP